MRCRNVLRSHRGYTLIELMAALSLVGFVLLGSWQLVATLSDGYGEFVRRQTQVSASSNRMLALRRLVARASINRDSVDQFVGLPSSTAFESRCETPEGWLRRCHVVLAIETGERSGITASVDREDSAELTHLGSAARLIYLDRAGIARQWRSEWGRSITIPLAIGVVMQRDTIVLPVGGGT